MIGFVPVSLAIVLVAAARMPRGGGPLPRERRVALLWLAVPVVGAPRQSPYASSLGGQISTLRANAGNEVLHPGLSMVMCVREAGVVPKTQAIVIVEGRGLTPGMRTHQEQGPDAGLRVTPARSRRAVGAPGAGRKNLGIGGIPVRAAGARDAVGHGLRVHRNLFFGSPPRPPGAAPRLASSRGLHRTRDGWQLASSSGWRTELAGTGRPKPGTRTPPLQARSRTSCA